MSVRVGGVIGPGGTELPFVRLRPGAWREEEKRQWTANDALSCHKVFGRGKVVDL